MVRHISIFFFKENIAENDKKKVEDALNRLKEELTGVEDYRVGRNCGKLPPPEAGDVPDFGELAQVIDFNSEEAAMNYPKHPAHMKFAQETSEYLEKIAAIDFVINEAR